MVLFEWRAQKIETSSGSAFFFSFFFFLVFPKSSRASGKRTAAVRKYLVEPSSVDKEDGRTDGPKRNLVKRENEREGNGEFLLVSE